MDVNDLPKNLFTFKGRSIETIYGLFVMNEVDPRFPDEFIFINKNSSLEMIMITFFHEYQHYTCRKTKCYCSKKLLSKDEDIIMRIVREKHAIENELRASLELKDVYLLTLSILSISNYILYDNDCVYKLASICIIDGKLWNEALSFLRELQKGKPLKVR